MPWVRLHGTKDYLDMVQILEKYPEIHQTFNLVPSLVEQIEDYVQGNIKDKFLDLSTKPASELEGEEKEFIRKKFFMINKERVISFYPRYYELYLKKERGIEFSQQDYLDLAVWFNLAWIDPYFRENMPELKNILDKGRFFTEEEKQLVLDKQIKILADILPTYKKFMANGQIEITVSPYYHPILPLIYNTKIAREANLKTVLPQANFAYPGDARAQIEEAVEFYQQRLEGFPQGMWPSEEAVSEHILPFIIQAGINWIVTDEVILFKSLKKKKRENRLLYYPYLVKRKEGNLNLIFRDRNLSDLISFVYCRLKTEDAVADFMQHLENIAQTLKEEDALVTVAMDGENAWEYYPGDGHDFLNLLYQRLSDSEFVKTVTINDYLKSHPAQAEIKHLACGSWIYADFAKWIGNHYKNKAWDCLAMARQELDEILNSDKQSAISDKLTLAYRQIYIAEGSDWFWWYGEDHGDFDRLFRMHLSNFYTIIGKDIPAYLKSRL